MKFGQLSYPAPVGALPPGLVFLLLYIIHRHVVDVGDGFPGVGNYDVEYVE
jgi:hypothetical protein